MCPNNPQVGAVDTIILLLLIELEPSKFQNVKIRHFDIYHFRSDGIPAIANESEQTGKCHQPDVAYLVTNMTTNISKTVPRAKCIIKKWQVSEWVNENKAATTSSIDRYVIIIVFVRSCVHTIATVKSLLQTAGVWSRGLAESSGVCVLRIIKLKIGGNCPYVSGRPRFQN